MSISRERVRAKVKTEAARILQTEVKDPRMGLVTVIDCDLSPDYRHSTIYVSILAEREGEVRRILGMLEDATGYVQRLIAGRLRTRVTPQIRFELDKGPEQSVKISGLLDELRKEREEREGAQAAAEADDAGEEDERE